MEFHESPGSLGVGMRAVSRGPARLWGNAVLSVQPEITRQRFVSSTEKCTNRAGQDKHGTLRGQTDRDSGSLCLAQATENLIAVDAKLLMDGVHKSASQFLYARAQQDMYNLPGDDFKTGNS